MNSSRMKNGLNSAAIKGQALSEEIAWLRSFGWSDAQIAMRLGIREETIRGRDQGHNKRRRQA